MAAPKPPPDPAKGEKPKTDYVPLAGVENIELYRKDGYHPVEIDDILDENYRVVHKLGFGRYGTVWLAVDQTSGQYVAIKVGRAEYSNLLEGFSMDRLHRLVSFDTDTTRSVIPPVLDEFHIDGPNGKHPCYVTTVGGANLERVKFRSIQGMFRPDVARAIAAQLVIAVAHAHKKETVHGDLTLSNVVLRLPSNIKKLPVDALYEKFGKPVRVPVVRKDGKPLTSAVPSECIKPVWMGKTTDEITLPDAKIMLIDFGESYNPSLKARDDSMASPAYQPPEALWDKIPMSFPSDIWTLACSLWDLVAWFPLFDSYISLKGNITAEQVAVLGRMPPGWWSKWGRANEIRRRAFDPEANNKLPYEFLDLETRFEQVVQDGRRDRGMEPMEEEEKKAFLSMIRSMLVYRPEKRATAKEVLKSEWMVRWAIPEYEKIRGQQG